MAQAGLWGETGALSARGPPSEGSSCPARPQHLAGGRLRIPAGWEWGKGGRGEGEEGHVCAHANARQVGRTMARGGRPAPLKGDPQASKPVIEWCNGRGKTALHIACAQGNLNLVQEPAPASTPEPRAHVRNSWPGPRGSPSRPSPGPFSRFLSSIPPFLPPGVPAPPPRLSVEPAAGRARQELVEAGASVNHHCWQYRNGLLQPAACLDLGDQARRQE